MKINTEQVDEDSFNEKKKKIQFKVKRCKDMIQIWKGKGLQI